MICEGLHSSVYLVQSNSVASLPVEPALDATAGPVAVKSVWLFDIDLHRPHDVLKEVRILDNLSHCNIIRFLGTNVDTDVDTFHIYMPLISLCLGEFLDCPVFTPLQPTSDLLDLMPPPIPNFTDAHFETISKSIIYQTLSAVSYLHSRDPPISHRDINPHNIMISHSGYVKLIDFGVAWDGVGDAVDASVTGSAGSGSWKETSDKMCCQVGTGPFRAPELLFSPSSYDAPASDLWCLGAMFAEFFAPLRASPADGEEGDDNDLSDEDEGKDEDKNKPMDPFIINRRTKASSSDTYRWGRVHLFDSTRGEIGLAWSIFKVRGTPNETNWPTFKSLKGAQNIVFDDVPGTDLRHLLPHMPRDVLSSDQGILHLIEQFLAYPPEKRLQAGEALRHQWFTQEPAVELPIGHPDAEHLLVRKEAVPSQVSAASNLESILKPWHERLGVLG